MKRIALILTILAAASCCADGNLTDWTLRREGTGQVYKVTVPCTVAGALNEAGVFGDGILEQRRYEDIDKSLFDAPWTFSTRFRASRGKHHVLRFNGLGYSADIELNGTRIASADTTSGPFAVREFDITPTVRGSNVLKVTVHRAPQACLNTGYVDWNPRPVDESMGILREVELISTPDVLVKDVFVKPELNPDDLSTAELTVSVTLANLSGRFVSGSLSGTCEAGCFCDPVSLAPHETRTVTVNQHVVDPRIWWTREMGSPELYRMSVSFIAGDKVSHSRQVRFGIRRIDSEIDSEGHRLFRLNGRPVLVKSAGWTDDIFQQDTHESIRTQVEMVADMGLNCIRFENIWGKDDAVYDCCDSLGILALAGFSCQWEWESYCGIPHDAKYGCIIGEPWESLAVRYFRDQILRLRNHPSLAGWLTGSDRIPNAALEEKYMAVYKELEYRPYICSAGGLGSALGGPSGMKMKGPYEYVGPDYWYLDTRNGGAYGFNTETSVGMNIPQLESVSRIVGPDHLWPLDGNWDYHCTASTTDMNSTRAIVEAMTARYGAPGGIEDFMRKAHALDYDATRSMFEAFRCNIPHTTGIVQWMLNSAWPSLYWQLYDWYLIPTAGYYGTRNACAPLQLVYNYKDHCVWAVNDAAEDTCLTAVMKVYGHDCQEIRSETAVHTFAFRRPEAVFRDVHGPCFLSLELLDPDGRRVAGNFYCLPEKDNVYDWDKADWYVTPVSSAADLSFVAELPQASLSMDCKAVEDGFLVTVTNNSSVIAYQNILKAKDASGNLVPGVFWSDNFFSLLPGQRREILCRAPRSCLVSLEGWNGVLADE